MRVLQTAIRQNSLRDYVAPLEQPPEIRIFIGRRASPPLRGGTHAGAGFSQKLMLDESELLISTEVADAKLTMGRTKYFQKQIDFNELNEHTEYIDSNKYPSRSVL